VKSAKIVARAGLGGVRGRRRILLGGHAAPALTARVEIKPEELHP
jgi:hypothetical protein